MFNDSNSSKEPTEEPTQVGNVGAVALAERPPRGRPRQRDAQRGLPSLEDRVKLARAYLATQFRLWPGLSQTALLPTPDDAAGISAMAEDFARRHVAGAISDERALDATLARFGRLAAAYLRYSCDNSSPRSLDDQLVNVLEKAARERLFVPWQLIFADASVTGLDASRQGYSSLKAVLHGGRHAAAADAVIIDEFSRASRDTFEWFRLSALCKRLRKNVLGATDGFILNSPMGEMMLMVFGMFSRFFIAQLREKVLRGMKGAARRKTSVGRPRLGYGLAPQLDAQGRPVLGADGCVVRERAIHAETMRYVMMAANWFALNEKTYSGIAKEFNRMKVDGSEGWRAKSIKNLLADPIYLGIVIFNRTRNEFDPETHKRTTVRNPHREWEVESAPHLRVWSYALWKKIRRRAYAIDERRRQRKAQRRDPAAPDTGGGSVAGARNADAPTTLLSGTLFCECGAELKLVRSGDHAAMGCYDGRDGLHGCTMTTVKATKIVEESVLGYVREHLLTESSLAMLVAAANAALSEEARRPVKDVAPLKKELKALTGQRDKLVDQLVDEHSHEFLQGIKERIKKLERRMKVARDAIVEAERQNQPPPPPLSAQDVLAHLPKLRELLNEETTAAALALRKLTGRMTVRHKRHSGKKGGVWILTFTPRLLPSLLERAKDSNLPEANTLTHVDAGKPLEVKAVTLMVDKRLSVQERIAPAVAKLLGQIDPETSQPYTIPSIAKVLGYSRDVTYKASTVARRTSGANPGNRRSSVSRAVADRAA